MTDATTQPVTAEITVQSLVERLKASPTFNEKYAPVEQELMIRRLDDLTPDQRLKLQKTLEAENQKLTEIEKQKAELFEDYKLKAKLLMDREYKVITANIETTEKQEAEENLQKQINKIQ